VSLLDEDREPYCSGFYLGDDTFVTANHCVKDKATGYYGRYQDYDPNKNEFQITGPFRVLHKNPEQDVALLKPAREVPHVRLTLAQKPPFLGQHVFAVGHPYGWGYHITEGRVSSPKRTGDPFGPETVWVQADIDVGPGMSGGPLLNGNGAVVGLTSWGVRGNAFTGFIHLDSLRALLKKGD
jgi:S1-C subfamily serine protease